MIMTARSGPCTLSEAVQRTRGRAFMVYNGTAYMHDPRIRLFDNTLEAATEATLLGAQGTSSANRLGACHNVPKTFQNAHTCRPSTACSARARTRTA